MYPQLGLALQPTLLYHLHHWKLGCGSLRIPGSLLIYSMFLVPPPLLGCFFLEALGENLFYHLLHPLEVLAFFVLCPLPSSKPVNVFLTWNPSDTLFYSPLPHLRTPLIILKSPG